MDFQDLQDRLLFAVPKKGRLHEHCMSLLKGADIQFHRRNRLDIALSTNLPIALVFLPASDIGQFVGSGDVDLGITGQDVIAESNAHVDELLSLGFGKCDLSFQVPMSSGLSVDDLIGRRIVTSFENIVSKYFHERESGLTHEQACAQLLTPSPDMKPTKTQITYVSGSVEAACALGLADGIVDLVESGETMRAAKLSAIGKLLSSQAVLICNPKKTQKTFD